MIHSRSRGDHNTQSQQFGSGWMMLDLPAGSAHAHAYVHARTQAASTADGRLLYCYIAFCHSAMEAEVVQM